MYLEVDAVDRGQVRGIRKALSEEWRPPSLSILPTLAELCVFGLDDLRVYYICTLRNIELCMFVISYSDIKIG